jgi:CRP/FNR family transcriptional regulator, cyclic AMP receptor protein
MIGLEPMDGRAGNITMCAADDLRFLGAVPYFRGLASDELARIAGRCHQRTLDTGEIIIMEGQPADGLYVVRSGKVRVFKTSSRGKEQVLIVLGPGETFNDVPVFDGGPNPACAQAASHGTSVCMVPTAVVMGLLGTNPRVTTNIVHVLAGRLRHLTAVVEDLSFRHITERVAKLLLAESAAAGGPISLTQERMATRVGTAREVVSRALRTLEQGSTWHQG